MKVIVPLAGPGFEFPNGSVKAEQLLDGQPLLLLALNNRPWSKSRQVSDGDYVFVLRQTETSVRFSQEFLSHWFPLSKVVFLSDFTAGAAFSALGGVSQIGHLDEPICVDLADILYSGDLDAQAEFEKDAGLGGIGLVFPSQRPEYSYLAVGADGRVTEAREKQVISQHASAGTYWFRNSTIFLKSIIHAVEDRTNQTHKGLFFVCPLFNGVIAHGYDVKISQVFDVRDVKLV